jgi:class 3 adenylate cyclase
VANDASFKVWWAKQERLAGSPGANLAFFRAQREADVRHVLPAIQAPTLIIQRRGDAYRRVEHGRYLAETIPGATYVELPGRDNLPYVGDQDAILDEVEEFLTGVRHSAEPDRVLATVLFTDIVGATSRAAELGDRAWRDLLERHNAVVRRELERGRGERWTRRVTASWRPSTGPLAQSGPRAPSPSVFRTSRSISGAGCIRGRWSSSKTTCAGSPYTSVHGRPHSRVLAKCS